MAVSWGSWEYSGGNGMRVGVDSSYSPSSPTSATSSVTVQNKWYIQNQYNYSDSQTLTGTGADAFTDGFTNSAGDMDTQLVITRNDVVTLNYGSTQSKTYTATISGAYNGVTPSKTITVTIPARPYTTPAIPTAVTHARVSDTQHTVAWTRNPTTAAPYTSQKIQRWDNVSATWSTVASGISGTATSYTDNTTVANRKYQYRVQAVNSAGTGTSASTTATYTTPAPPTDAVAAKNASNNVVITWTPNASYTEFDTEVWDSAGGAPYVLLATVAGGTGTYTHVGPSGATHVYRVFHKTNAGAQGVLTSTYSQSNLVQVVAPPNAPTNLAPSGIPLDATAIIPFTWLHNPVDSSPQSKFQVRHRIVGAPGWTEPAAVTSVASTWNLPAATYANGLNIEWQVRTWGVATTGGSEGTGASPYSASATFITSTPPTVSITSPADASVVTVSTATVIWAYFDAEGSAQSEWTATLSQAGVPVETLSAASAVTTATFLTPILDGQAYTITVAVRDGVGMWSTPDANNFTVDYLPPADVLVTGFYDAETGTVALTLEPQAPVGGVTVAATSVNIERRVDGGPWVMIAENIAPDSTVLDTMPGIHNTNEYRTTVYSAIPSSKVMDPTLTIVTEEKDRGFLSTGLYFEHVLALDCDMSVTAQSGREKALYTFAGRQWPVEFAGSSLSKVVNVGGTSTGPDGTWEDFEEMAAIAGIVLWRDPSGRRVFGSLGIVSTGLVNMAVPDVWTVGFPVTQVDYAG